MFSPHINRHSFLQQVLQQILVGCLLNPFTSDPICLRYPWIPGVYPMRLLSAPGANLRPWVVLFMLLTNHLSKIPMTSSLDSINSLEMSIQLRDTLDFLLSMLVVCLMERQEA